MTVERKGSIGSLIVSDVVIAELIMHEINAPHFHNAVWASTPQGVIIENSAKSDSDDVSRFVESKMKDDGTVELEFSVVTRFGVSIKKATKELSDMVEGSVSSKLGCSVSTIIINIAGVRMKNVARRSTRVVYHYGAQ